MATRTTLKLSLLDGSACGRLTKRAFALHELPSLIEAILTSKDEGTAARSLPREDAQIFIDVIGEALDRPDFLPPRTRKRCLKLLYKTCGHYRLVPRALKIPVRYDRSNDALYMGGFADVWKGEYRGRSVAVKVIRTYSSSNLQKMISKSYKEVVIWKTLRHPNVLPLIGVTMSETRFEMVSDWMVNGNINEFVRAHPDANLLELLIGAAKGLIYIHSQGMVHGDLKGVNVLVDQAGRARLADFGLLTILSDPANMVSSSSCNQSGTVRWMGPELLDPTQFGRKNSRPTKSSDCYALGMVIYETIGGNVPFHERADFTVPLAVVRGERPSRGVGKFTDNMWKTLQWCWAPQPNSRPRIKCILRCLEMISGSPVQSPPGVKEKMEKAGDDRGSANGSSGIPIRVDGTAKGERNIAMSSSSGHPTNRPLKTVTTASGSLFVRAIDRRDAGGLGREATVLLPLISPKGSNNEGTHQGVSTISGVIGEAERPGPDMQTSDPHQLSGTQGLARSNPSLLQGITNSRSQPLEGGTALCPTAINATQGHPRSSNIDNPTTYPIQNMISSGRCDAPAVRVGPPLRPVGPNGPKFPPLPQGGSRVVPQLSYVCEKSKKNLEDPIKFSTRGRRGVRLLDARDGKLEDMDDRGGFQGGIRLHTMKIWIHFPGYPSSIEVKRVLEQQARNFGTLETSPRQVLVTRKGDLVQEVSRYAVAYVKDLASNRALFPFDSKVGEQWRIGQGRMKVMHMAITELVNVSSELWSPVICIE